MKIKKINKRWKFFLIAILFVVFCSGFGMAKSVKAASYFCTCFPEPLRALATPCTSTYDICETTCTKTCQNLGYVSGTLSDSMGNIGVNSEIDELIGDRDDTKKSLCPKVDLFDSDLKDIIGCILLYILGAIGKILQYAGTLFGWIIEPTNVGSIIDNSIIYSSWGLVRDVLNVSFIMFLLFSAFSTVFQVSKYNYKNTLLTLVLMALLVNFSYPITRFIIDLSNVLMFYLVDTLDLGRTFISDVAGQAYLGNIIHPTTDNPDVYYLIASAIFLFIFTVTILAIALLFLIRTVALAILVIFSPLAFVGEAIPPLSSYASDWWKQLFSYAFFGPVMVFMLITASKMMAEIDFVGHGSMEKIANLNTTDPDFIASISFFTIPIVILWIGLGMAGKMGISGASLIVGKAEGFMKGAGRWAVSPVTGAYKAGRWSLKSGSSAMLKAFDRNVLGSLHLSPRQFIHGWKESTKEAEESKLAEGKGVWHDRLNYLFSGTKQKTNYGEMARQSLVSKKMKQLKDVSQESSYLLDRLSDSMGSSNPESVAETKSILRILFSNNDQDEIMGYIKNNIQKGTPIGDKLKDMGFGKHNWGVSEKNVSNAALTFLSKSGLSDDEINKELLDLGDIAAAKQGLGYSSVFYDSDSRKLKRIVGDDSYNGLQGLNTAKKMMTMGEAQNIPKQMHRNNFTDQEQNLNETGKALLRLYASPVAIKHSERHKNDFYKAIAVDDNGTIAKQMLDYAAKLKSGTADGWDDKLKNADGTEGGYSENIQDTTQAIHAAAWVSALKLRAGASLTQIETDVKEAKFTKEETEKIMTMAQAHQVK